MSLYCYFIAYPDSTTQCPSSSQASCSDPRRPVVLLLNLTSQVSLGPSGCYFSPNHPICILYKCLKCKCLQPSVLSSTLDPRLPCAFLHSFPCRSFLSHALLLLPLDTHFMVDKPFHIARLSPIACLNRNLVILLKNKKHSFPCLSFESRGICSTKPYILWSREAELAFSQLLSPMARPLL